MGIEIERPHVSTSAQKLGRSDLTDRVIGSVCLAVGVGLVLWARLGLFGKKDDVETCRKGSQLS